jgi:hypothetical protein
MTTATHTEHVEHPHTHGTPCTTSTDPRSDARGSL